jgi:hypothetical protein
MTEMCPIVTVYTSSETLLEALEQAKIITKQLTAALSLSFITSTPPKHAYNV